MHLPTPLPDLLPASPHAETPRARRFPLAALLHRPVQRLLAGWRRGSLTLQLPDGRRLVAQGAEAGPHAQVVVHRWRTLLRLATGGDIGLAVGWRNGEWSTPDLLAVLQAGLANQEALAATLRGGLPVRAARRVLHALRANTRRGSRANIAFHYDLGNDFYKAWLDDSLLYSSALYATGDETLEAAQTARLSRLVELVDCPPGAQVLEIGIGWGALALALAQRGAHVTGLTLSAEQLALARERAARGGLQDRLDLRLQDYRDVRGRYARIVSIEMIEAVGQAWWPTYFATLRDRLAPGGHAVLQAITITDDRFDDYRARPDFIQRFIFPGGMLPSRAALREQAARAGLVLHEELLFGASYAATLADWRERFIAAWPAIREQGFDERFRRLWEYYLVYCEAGFRSGRIDVGLYTLRHA